MGDVGPDSAQQAELMRRFTSFLDADNSQGKYSQRIKDIVMAPEASAEEDYGGRKRLIVSLDDIRDFDPTLADTMMRSPIDLLPVLERAMQDLISGYRQDLADNPRRLADYRIGFDGAFGSRKVSPRNLSARLISNLVCVEGIVTKATTIRPRLVLSVHYCPRTGRFHEKMYKDNASVSSLAAFTQNSGMPGSSYPTKDEEGNPLETEFGKCWYRDSQRMSIQEMPEHCGPGQIPRTTEILIEGDLCDACKPGDRVQINGIYRAMGNTFMSTGSAIFRTFVVANHITIISGVEGRPNFTPVVHDADIANILSFSRSGNAFDTLSRSIAPSIFGHEFIKKALLLLLIGGKEQNLANGTHLRGDINVLMVGDPSTAKSQLLRYILVTAPLAISTTGRGSSGVGLTAAVTSDPDTGDRHLEAGAMVLADRGVVCIDEFDKMSDEDRVAIHEVMEQQTVTIAKAGIHASLNARCSVIAAANPVYGCYDTKRKPHENIALPDSLLSRFDLLFIVLDTCDKERDRYVSDHVLRAHQYRKPTHTLDDIDDEHAPKGTNRIGTASEDAIKETPVYEDASTALYVRPEDVGKRRSKRQAAKSDAGRILNTDFLKLYISYARHRCQPTLTPAAAEFIAGAYRDLRQDMDSQKTLPITARCLETLIRLATAHAKCRLDKTSVTAEDAEMAVTLLKFALFNQAEPDKSEKVFRRRTRSKSGEKGSDDDSDNEDDEGGDEGATEGPVATPRRSARKTAEKQKESMPESMQAEGGEDEEEAQEEEPPTPSRAKRKTKKSVLTTPRRSARNKTSQTEAPTQDSAPTQESAPTPEGEPSAAANIEGDELRQLVQQVKDALNDLRGREDVVQLKSVIDWFKDKSVNRAQVMAGLEKLQKDDIVLIADDSVFIV